MRRLMPALGMLALALPVTRPIAAIQAPDTTSNSGPIARFEFEGTVESSAGAPLRTATAGELSFAAGIEGQALRLRPDDPSPFFAFRSDQLSFDAGRDFSVQFWMRTDAQSDRRFAVLSQKRFPDNSLASQKNAGWVFYVSGGTWAWSLGSGSRRITYERDNGSRMPLNDGRWHQLTMTYSSARSQVRLFYDGVNWVSYHVRDSNGFDFSNSSPAVVGWDGRDAESRPEILPTVEAGAKQLQVLVDVFNELAPSEVEPDEFIHLIVNPRKLFEEKVMEATAKRGADSLAVREAMDTVDWQPVEDAESALMSNPYTVHQVLYFMETAPLSKVYSLADGEIVIQEEGAEAFAEKERLHTPDFDLDKLAVWDRVLSTEEVRESYSEHLTPGAAELEERLSSLTSAVWNIWHGGKHFTADEHGWDSRVVIAEMLETAGADVIMMQETYSSGDFIAAELGYYFATTVDWDYLNQGSNISVLSRYPITEFHVQEDSPFNNVGAKISISQTQDLYAMSNWYGMAQFPAVFDFHAPRFAQSDDVPTLFAGDFNAVPHTDGGDSPASVTLLEAGFTDAFRSLYPDVDRHPGATHRNGERIDQLYYKGTGLANTSTQVISTRPGGFPSDHFLILATFDLDYSTRDSPGRRE